MSLTRHESSRCADFADQFFGRWPEFFRRPLFVWSDVVDELLPVEEFREDGATVIRAHVAGIDPEKDVELSVSGGMLHIVVEHREEKRDENSTYLRRELRCGSLRRDLVIPERSSEANITAT